MTRKITYFEGWSLFKLNNFRRALAMALKFYTSVAIGLKLKVRKWDFFSPKTLNRVKWIEMGGFFIDFIKGLLLQLTQETKPFKYLYLNYAWQINQLNYLFELGLLISHALHFQVFNAANNLKGTRATHSFLGLNENFIKLKIADKSFFLTCFWESILSPIFFLMGAGW